MRVLLSKRSTTAPDTQNQSLSRHRRSSHCFSFVQPYDFRTMADPSKRILIVDDDQAIVAGLEVLLTGDWEVRAAYNGREARAAFVDFSPDVVLLDMQLPDASGIDLLHDFKMYSESVAVIMMSGVGTF